MMSSAEAAVDRPKPWGFYLAAVLLAGLFVPTFQQLIHIWLLDANYSHGFFIVPISLWLAWRVAREYPMPERGDAVQGTFALGAGLTLHLVGVTLRSLPIEFAAMMLILRGMAVLMGGRDWANRLLFPTFFLAFLFPLPAAETTLLAVWLQDVIAAISTAVLGLFYFCYRVGNNIHIAGVAEPMYVAQECSGVRQIMAFVALGALVAYLGKTGWLRGLILVTLAVPVAIIANVVRVLLMGVGLVHFGPTWLSTWMHDLPALFTLPLGILGFFGLVWLVAPSATGAGSTAIEPAAQEPAAQAPTAKEQP
jgi:exosortase